MATTPYIPTAWNDKDVITKDKLDQEQFNAQFVYEHTPRVRLVRNNGLPKDTGFYIMGGRVALPKNSKGQTSSAIVHFPPGFAPGTLPMITTGIVSQPKRKVFCVISGLGDEKVPDHRGFRVYAYVEDATMRKPDGSKKKIAVIDKQFFISYIAIGQGVDAT